MAMSGPGIGAASPFPEGPIFSTTTQSPPRTHTGEGEWNTEPIRDKKLSGFWGKECSGNFTFSKVFLEKTWQVFPNSAFALLKCNVTKRFKIKDQGVLAVAAWIEAETAPRRQMWGSDVHGHRAVCPPVIRNISRRPGATLEQSCQ